MLKKTQKVTPDLGIFLSEFNRSLMLIVDKSLLVGNFIAKVKTIIPVESIHVFLLDESTGKYKPQDPEEHGDIVLSGKDNLIQWLSVNEKELLISQHPDIVDYFSEKEHLLLRELKAELIYPLKVMNKISGMILLGNKKDGTHFSEQEVMLLSLLFDQAAFAIEHASLCEIHSDRIKRMYRTDRLAILGELAAGAAHEIRNPLTAIRSTIQYLSKDFQGDPVKSEMATELIGEVERINKIVQGLLSFSRPSEPNMSLLDIPELIRQSLVLIHSSLVKHAIDVQLECHADKATINADAEQLKQVFLNITLNAIEIMAQNEDNRPRRLKIRIETGAIVDAESRFLLVTFEDTGAGIKESDLDKVFNPFFTTKEEGTGLGLAISYGVVKRHGGEIEVQSTPDKGTKFTVKLPQHR